ncbi:type II secretion system major pseudopilin GspG [Plasticicumulans acidivorans]|uniref:General secretion pathway protein G n=1 Tax=Plasticicumulans acidivorans TaxID=886464 RepID=A0A317N085_9GAMM|nr:type II secretion system major pseudopilin GspG [Plasticicumulans acidivorans]PWV65856.1 general secretion pathway protein G [Plasticicumulans acidivorans]
MPALPNRRHGGFTLIEYFAVLVILLIAAALIIPRVMERPDEKRQRTARIEIRQFEDALNRYKHDNGRYPTTAQGLDALVHLPTEAPEATNWRGPYEPFRERIPKDPWGRTYLYANPGQHGPIDIFSLGADGHPGGEGVDADLGNWNLGEP